MLYAANEAKALVNLLAGVVVDMLCEYMQVVFQQLFTMTSS